MSSFPPLTAVSMASASILNARVSSSISCCPIGASFLSFQPPSFLSCLLSTPRARCNASSRSAPRRLSTVVSSVRRRGLAESSERIVGEVAIASYWCNRSGFGSSLFSGSSCVESSGMYGQLREVSGRRGTGSPSASDVGHVGTAASLADGAGEPILGLGVHVSLCFL